MKSTSKTASLLKANAQRGNRITFLATECDAKPQTLWAGLGNRAGLHSFADELLRNKWKKSGARFMQKVQNLTGGKLTILVYRATSRDRGRWIPVNCIIV